MGRMWISCHDSLFWGFSHASTTCFIAKQTCLGVPGGSDNKGFACNAGDPSLILGQENPLGKRMTTHFNIFAWRIPWKEESGRLQSMGSQRVRHNWMTNYIISLLGFVVKQTCFIQWSLTYRGLLYFFLYLQPYQD